MFSKTLGRYRGEGLLGHVAALVLVFWGAPALFPRWLHVCTATGSEGGLPFPHGPPALVLLVTAILTGLRWDLLAVLTCIPLLASEVEHLFIYLLPIYMSSWEKWLFRSSAHWIVCLVSSCPRIFPKKQLDAWETILVCSLRCVGYTKVVEIKYFL